VKKIIPTWIAFALLAINSFGQNTFERMESFPFWSLQCCSSINSIIQCHDSCYVGAGSLTYGFSRAFYWEKIDSTGNFLWNHWLRPVGSSGLNSVEETSDGGFIFCGWGGSSYHPLCIFKTDQIGLRIWQRFIGTNMGDYDGYCAKQTLDGGFVIAGSKILSGIWDAEIIKTDSTGSLIWSKSYGGPTINNQDEFYSVAQTSDSGFIATGYSGQTQSSILIVRTNESGDTLWSKNYADSLYPYAGVSIDQAMDSGFVVAGYFKDSWSGYGGSYFIKINRNGNIVWQKRLGVNDSLALNSVKKTSDGGYILSGRIGYLISHACLIKTDSTGNILWAKLFSGAGVSASETHDNGYIISTEDLIIKTDSFGNTICEQRSFQLSDDPGILFPIAYSIAETSDTLLLLQVPADYDDFDTLEIDNLCNSLSVPESGYSSFKILIHPNPSEHFIMLNPEGMINSIEIYNYSGILLKRKLYISNYDRVDISDLPPSMYFIKAFTEKGSVVEKFIKQ
jgi:hypothetical protein